MFFGFAFSWGVCSQHDQCITACGVFLDFALQDVKTVGYLENIKSENPLGFIAFFHIEDMLIHKIISELILLWKSWYSQLLCPKSAVIRSWKKKSYFILQSIGCDDYLGSDKVIDKCGICGGDNTACKVVSGVFKHTLTNLGYHKIVEIPEGATKINITEMSKSNNYLGKLHLSEWRMVCVLVQWGGGCARKGPLSSVKSMSRRREERK